MSLVLASASPRRREILLGLGVSFDVVVPDVVETKQGEPAAMVLENARRKAAAGAELVSGQPTVMGVDTDVFLDGVALGKPSGREDAGLRLQALSGRSHDVLSGLVLLGPRDGDGRADERFAVARTRVTFRELSTETVRIYLDSGEWRDRAGAYAIQGLGSILAATIEGDVSNVVGLPVTSLLELAPELIASRQ